MADFGINTVNTVTRDEVNDTCGEIARWVIKQVIFRHGKRWASSSSPWTNKAASVAQWMRELGLYFLQSTLPNPLPHVLSSSILRYLLVQVVDMIVP